VNTAHRYRALIAAGIIPGKTDEPDDSSATGAAQAKMPSETEIRAIVREYRDQVPNAVFLIDLMLRDDLSKLIDGKLSTGGAAGRARLPRGARQPCFAPPTCCARCSTCTVIRCRKWCARPSAR